MKEEESQERKINRKRMSANKKKVQRARERGSERARDSE